jgi:hypothetical protein
MTNRWRALASARAAIALLSIAPGCSSNSAPSTAAAGTPSTDAATADASRAGSPTDAGEAGAPSDGPPTGMLYKLQWEIIEGLGPASDGGMDASADMDAATGDGGEFEAPPIAGVTVCVNQMPSIACVTSASDGTFTLEGLPGGTNLALTLNKTGYIPTLIPIQTARTDMDGRSTPVSMNSSAAPPPAVPVTLDWTESGQILAFAIGPSPTGAMNNFPDDPGAVISLSPMSGSGPYYQSTGGSYDLDASAYDGFYAMYVNVAPGMYTLTYTDSRNDCEAINFPYSGWGFPVTTPPHSIQVPVLAGYLTGAVGVLCTPNSTIVKVDGG